jgi:ribosomal protein S12 methylthiotransferase accessory factor
VKRDLGGTLRACDPAETLTRVRPLLPALGITRVADVTGLDRIGIPVAMCVRPNARSLSVSQGKGVSRDLARTSAIMESIELYHAEHLRPPDVVASYEEMRRRYRTVDPRRRKPASRWAAYKPSRKMAWIKGTDLASGEAIFVPHSMLSFDSTGADPDVGVLWTDSNGLASGNDRWEAICHGLFEVIERDCEWRWRRLSPTERRRRLLNNDTIESPLLRSLLARCLQADIEPRIWDTTSDLGLPAYHCILWEAQGWRPLGPYFGAGCHVSKEVACSRALTEAAQSRLTYITGSRDDLFPGSYDARRAHWTSDARDPLPAGILDFRERPALPLEATFEDDVHAVVDRLVDSGFPHVVVVDLTRPDFNIPVVRVVVPGLRAAYD